jgi:hypothetical protein
MIVLACAALLAASLALAPLRRRRHAGATA